MKRNPLASTLFVILISAATGATLSACSSGDGTAETRDVPADTADAADVPHDNVVGNDLNDVTDADRPDGEGFDSTSDSAETTADSTMDAGETGSDADSTDGTEIIDDAGDSDSSPDVPPPPPGPLRIMTFNLRMPFDSDPLTTWDERKSVVASVIRDFDADVVATQEGYLDQLDYIAGALPDYAWVGGARNEPEFMNEHNAVVYNKTRFRLVDTTTLMLSETPEVIGSKLHETDQNYPRIITWARLERRSDGYTFDFFATHWDNTDIEYIRSWEAAITLTIMNDLSDGGPSVLGGDFNTGVGEVPWQILAGDADYNGISGALTDSWTELSVPEEGSFHGFTGTAGTSRIDWIMHSTGFKAESIGLIKTSVNGVYPSDHFPCGAVFADPAAE